MDRVVARNGVSGRKTALAESALSTAFGRLTDPPGRLLARTAHSTINQARGLETAIEEVPASFRENKYLPPPAITYPLNTRGPSPFAPTYAALSHRTTEILTR